MPTYNGMPHIRSAVESVLSQNFLAWELIISDDGSSDGTLDYLKSINDTRVRVIRQQINLGIFGNLNFLLKEAQSPITKILCQDDMLLAGALERITVFMEQRPNCAISRCWAEGDEAIFSKGGALQWEGTLPARLEPAAAVLAFATFGNLVGNLCKAACRPQLVLNAGGFDQRLPYAGDYEGWVRVANTFGLDFLNEELVFERRHDQQNSVLLNKRNELYPQINQVLTSLAKHVAKEDLPLLKTHWTVHFLSQRVPRFVRELFAGRFRSAAAIWSDLPIGISPALCAAAYPFQKWNGAPIHWTTRKLLKRIKKLNRLSNE
jgi:glycosyltransferase involved in cell wall biosynthesis